MSTLQNGDRDLTDFDVRRGAGRDSGRHLHGDFALGGEGSNDREISLGTGMILGIFFALALLCAVFFGFGYSMGRKSAQPVGAAADAGQSGSIFSSFKPSPGSPVGAAAKQAAAEPVDAAGDQGSNESAEAEAPAAVVKQAAVVREVQQPETETVTEQPQSAPVRVAAKSAPAAAAAAVPAAGAGMPAASSAGTLIVQVAAVSHQEDADLLLSALKKRGYPVFLRQEATDKLIHVQVGPFAAKKDAEAMRQRLLTDGYNAILK